MPCEPSFYASCQADAVRTEAAELAALEARYWHGFNDLQLHMRAHAEERGVLLRRVPPLACTLDMFRVRHPDLPPPNRCAAHGALHAGEHVAGMCFI